MKKLYLLLMVLFFVALSTQAQLLEYNFDSYTVGQQLAQQSGLPWTTWSESPGSDQDAFITDERSESNPNSVKIMLGNDNMLLLGDSVTGKFKVNFSIFIPAGKGGYYNVLQEFNEDDPSNSHWGVEVFFDADGTGRIHAVVKDTVTFSFNHDEWIEVENYIDLDNDLAEVIINGSSKIAWPWTSGAWKEEGPLQLAALDFCADNDPHEFYIDNVIFSDSHVGIDESGVAETWVSVFPNPCKDAINISLTGNKSSSRILLYNTTGQLMQNTFIAACQNFLSLDMIDYPAGIYVLCIYNSKGLTKMKVIKE